MDSCSSFQQVTHITAVTVPMMFFYTSFRMQLAVDVQIPDEFGGLNGEAIYIGIIRFFSTDKNPFWNIPSIIKVHFLSSGW